MTKPELRNRLRSCLLAMPDDLRVQKSRRACRNLIDTPQFEQAATVMMYLSLPHEVDTHEAILDAWQRGKTVAVPKVSWEQRHMIPVQIASLETDFSTDAAGLRNPISGVPVPFDQIDLVVAPALGFDRNGNRLGRGGAFYDRFFAHEQLKAARCGLAFAEQVLDSIPVTEADQRVHFLVTDEKVIYFDN